MYKYRNFLCMSWSPEEPYNALPLIPPDESLETVAVLKKLVNARAEVSGLDEALVSLPNPSVFVHSLALLEAQASSEIENIVTTADELFRAETNDSEATPGTREALRYKVALLHGQELMEERAGLITIGHASEICSEIRGTTRAREPILAIPLLVAGSILHQLASKLLKRNCTIGSSL